MMIQSNNLIVIFHSEVKPALQFNILNLISDSSKRRIIGQEGGRQIHLINEFISGGAVGRLTELLPDLGLQATVKESDKGLGLLYARRGSTEVHTADRVLECTPRK
jgi:hypothetical protein